MHLRATAPAEQRIQTRCGRCLDSDHLMIPCGSQLKIILLSFNFSSNLYSLHR